MTRNSIAELALACVATHPSVGERVLADVLSQLNSSLHRETHERLVNKNECSKTGKATRPQRGPGCRAPALPKHSRIHLYSTKYTRGHRALLRLRCCLARKNKSRSIKLSATIKLRRNKYPSPSALNGPATNSLARLQTNLFNSHWWAVDMKSFDIARIAAISMYGLECQRRNSFSMDERGRFSQHVAVASDVEVSCRHQLYRESKPICHPRVRNS